MHELTRDEVLALQPSNRVYHVKLWRLFEPEPLLKWEGDTELYVERTVGSRRHPEALAIVAPRGLGWAEGDAGDVTEDGRVVVEDYMLEIFSREE